MLQIIAVAICFSSYLPCLKPLMGRTIPSMSSNKQPGFATRAIHVGGEPDPGSGAVAPPIVTSSTFAHEELGARPPYSYSRTNNPTRERLEQCLTSLEGGVGACCFASGVAAIHAVASLCRAGEHVIAPRDIYGGTYRLFEKVMTQAGIEFTYVDMIGDAGPANIASAIRPNTRLVHTETPSNPTMRLTDLAAVAKLCQERGLISSVDNTFLSPYFQRPLELGIDISIHSTTKFLNGHSDGIGGAVICAKQEHHDRINLIQRAVGAVLSPFDCWLVLRGVKTLAVRMEQHERNGRAVAEFLAAHPKVGGFPGKARAVNYPGLATHPQHELAKRQQSGFGSLLSFETGSLESAKRFFSGLKVAVLGESLGAVETLVNHPATMSHASLGVEGRAAAGVTDGLVRISVGIEDAGDIIADLDQALAGI